MLTAIAVVVTVLGVLFVKRRRAAIESGLPFRTRIGLLIRLIRFRLIWGIHDSNLRPEARLGGSAKSLVASNPLFVSPAEAVAKISPSSVVLNCGFAANDVCFPFYMAIRERYDRDQVPLNLTWLTVNANGARGVAPGSIDQLAHPSIINVYVAGHLETAKRMLQVGDAGEIELHNIPIGTFAELVAVQGRDGGLFVDSAVGIGTFLDPRCGSGSQVTSGAKRQFIQVAPNGELRFSIPAIDVVVLNAKRADTKGNVYLHLNTTITESIDAVRAAKRRRGLVLVSVQAIVDPIDSVNPALIIPASMIDAICLCDAPRMMDPIGVSSEFVARDPVNDAASRLAYADTWAKLRYINTFIGATPKRTKADIVLGRLASTIFVETFKGESQTTDGRLVGTIGIGLPEEVSQNIIHAGLTPGRLTLCTESGTIGGLPAMGLFFGAAIRPERVMSEAEIFQYLRTRLTTTCLGALEVDERGNVNVSRRGSRVTDFVGTGGFPNLVAMAKNIVFMFSWTNPGRRSAPVTFDAAGRVQVRRGKCKLVRRVREVTFSAEEALRLGKRVYYCSNVGVFQLQATGLVLTHIFAGVDPQRDVIGHSCTSVSISESLTTIDRSVVTGAGFNLNL